MAKKYFSANTDQEMCYPLSTIKDMAKFDGLNEVEVIEAKAMTGQGLFWCTQHLFPGHTGDGGCGKECNEYEPRNGKNGRCSYSSYCYEPTDIKRTIKIK